MRKTRVKFDAKALQKSMLKQYVDEQNELLIRYAQQKIIDIGNTIYSWNSANHMDRTGNLLDSLLWGVSYDGKLVKGGFYTDSMASGTSYLHEWMPGDTKYLEPVNGRALAKDYLNSYGNNGAKGWRVFFAILAPYWGYWEKGFKMKSGFGDGISGVGATYQFAVMTEYHDQIRRDLKPMRVRFRVSVRKYKKENLDKRWNKYAGI